MKFKLRILLLAVFCATITPQVQAWTLASAWQSMQSFFCNDSDSKAVSVAKYSLVAGALLGSYYYLVKKFFYSSDNKPKSPLKEMGELTLSAAAVHSSLSSPRSLSSPPGSSAPSCPIAQHGTILSFLKEINAAGKPLPPADQKADQIKTATKITLSALSKSCSQYPERAQGYSPSAVPQQEFEHVLTQYKKLMNDTLEQPNVWVNPKEKMEGEFKPFVQKLVLLEKSEVAMWGDLHGSVHSLLRSLTKLKKAGCINNEFKIIIPNFYMFFLGDYVDRGNYGVEVIYTLLRLKLANPDKVFLARGNHEDIAACKVYGFSQELKAKFNYKEDDNEVYSIYETMPLAIFLGKPNSTEYIQCCHGGIEPGFNPQELFATAGSHKYEWLSQLKRKDWIEGLPEDIKKSVDCAQLPGKENYEPQCAQLPCAIGFMWNDFIDTGSEEDVLPGRDGFVWTFGKRLTQAYNTDGWFKKSPYKIRSIIRAHQHNGQMLFDLIKNKGIHNLWDGLVYTLLSAPAMGFERAGNQYDFAYDSFVIVNVQDTWPITHYCTPIPKSKK